MRTREATFTERATWGTCPVCHAKNKEECGYVYDQCRKLTPLKKGKRVAYHPERFNNSPTHVKLEAVK